VKRPVTIAAVQLPSVAPGKTHAARQRANFDLAAHWLEEAGRRGADIACIGETFNVLGCKLTRANTPPLVKDAWAHARAERGRLPRAVNFVSGPSRTADIEQTVTMGAHGPYRVHIILVGA